MSAEKRLAALRGRWAVFEDEDGVFRIVTENGGDDVTWPEMGLHDCEEVVAAHNAGVSVPTEPGAPDPREDKVRADFDDAVEDVHRAFCDPEHELVGEWDRDMAEAIRRNGYTLVRSRPVPAPEPSARLNVERLARALEEHFGPSFWPGHTDVTILGDTPDDIARTIARAYALAATPQDPEA